MRSISRVVALDAITQQEAIHAGVPAERIEIIPNAILLRRAPNALTEPRSIVFIGRLAQQKRIESLMIAYEQLLETIHEAPQLLIAGGCAEKTTLEELAGQLEIAGQYKFLGNVPEPEDVLEDACCFVNPSESEGLPNAVLEALAFGVPVLLSDIPVHRELATAVGMEDFLFPVGNAQALAFKLRNFLELQDKDKNNLRQRCAEYAQRFKVEIRDDAYLGMYRTLLNQHHFKG